MSANTKVAATIRRIRQEARFSAQDIAAKADMTYARYTAIERNETKITVDDLYKIAAAFEVLPSALLAVIQHL